MLNKQRSAITYQALSNLSFSVFFPASLVWVEWEKMLKKEPRVRSLFFTWLETLRERATSAGKYAMSYPPSFSSGLPILAAF